MRAFEVHSEEIWTAIGRSSRSERAGRGVAREGLVLKWPEVIPRKDYGRVIRQVLVMADMVRDVGRAPRATKPAEEEPAELDDAPARDFSVVPRIQEFLGKGPAKTSAIMKALGLERRTVRSALTRMGAKSVARESGRGGEGTYALPGKVGPRRLPTVEERGGSIPARVKALLESGDFTSVQIAERLGVSTHSVQDVMGKVGARKAGGDGTRKSPTVWSLRRTGKPGPRPGYKVKVVPGEGMAEIERLLRTQHLTTLDMSKLARVSQTYALRVAKRLGAIQAGKANDGSQLWHLNGAAPLKSEATA